MARPSTRTTTDAPPAERSQARSDRRSRSPGDSPLSEELHVRNYDVERPCTLRVTVTDGEETAFEWTYYLGPGEFRSELGVLDPGTYEVTVETESCGTATTTCEIGPAADATALVETGNLTVAVSKGAY